MIGWLMRLGGVLVAPRRSFEALLHGARGGLGDVLWFMFAAMLATWPEHAGVRILAFGRSPMQALAMLFNLYLGFAALPLLGAMAIGFLLVGLLRLRGQRIDLGRVVKVSVYLLVPVGLAGMLGAVLAGFGLDLPVFPHGLMAVFLAADPPWVLLLARLVVSYGYSVYLIWVLARAAFFIQPDPVPENVAVPKWGGWLVGAWLGTALVFSAGWVASHVDELRPVRPGDAAPAFSLPTVDGGRPVSLQSLRGQPLVIEFWGTWCQVCVQHMPELAAWAAAHPEVPVLAIHPLQADDTEGEAEVHAFVKDGKYKPIRFLVDRQDVANARYRVASMPTFVVIGADGRIVDFREGASGDMTWLDRALGLNQENPAAERLPQAVQ